MQKKLILNCFKLCLLILLCTAAPSSDSDTSSDDSEGPGKIVKLQGDESPINTGADNEGLSDDEGANGGPINAEEKDDAPVADEAHDVDGDNAIHDNEEHVNGDEEDAPVGDEQIDAETQDNAVQDHEEPVNADNHAAPVTDEPIDEEKKDNEVHDDSSDSTKEAEPANGPIDEEKKDKAVLGNNLGDNMNIFDKNNKAIVPRGFKFSPAEITKFKIWPEARIPYYIDELSYDKVLGDKIRHYLDEARTITGLQFEELSEPPDLDDERWVFFVNRRGQLDCKDYNTNSFTIRGVQKVIIGYNCLQHGGPMAAIVLALLGVPPQHNAPDRDKYIKVDIDHILPDKKGLFKRLKDGDWLFHDLPYDFDSVSHYPAHKYTADGSETIKLLKQKRQRSSKATGTGSSDYMLGWLPFGIMQYISLHDEKKTYSATDISKIFYLYSNVMQNKPRGIKAEDCKALYRAGPNFRNMKLTEPIKTPERPKPAKYLAAVRNNNGPDKLLSHPMDIKGELLSELDDD